MAVTRPTTGTEDVVGSGELRRGRGVEGAGSVRGGGAGSAVVGARREDRGPRGTVHTGNFGSEKSGPHPGAHERGHRFAKSGSDEAVAGGLLRIG